MKDTDFIKMVKYAQAMIETKTVELRTKIPTINILLLTKYIFEVLLKHNKVRDINDLSYYIYNIKINKLIEYINLNALTDESVDMQQSIEALLK